jgi:competence protein ComEC
MSFAATIALIVGFAALDGSVYRERLPRWMMPVFTLVLSSVIGGLSTAPYAAAHFNRFTDYGLLANLLTVPVMGAVIMPAGAVAALLAPIGLAWLPLCGSWSRARAGSCSSRMDFRAGGVGDGDPRARGLGCCPCFTLGAIWLILWRGRVQAGTGAGGGVGFALWVAADGRCCWSGMADWSGWRVRRAGAVGGKGRRVRGRELAAERRRPRPAGRGGRARGLQGPEGRALV